MTDAPLPPKKDVAIALLKGPSVFVHLDPRCEGVVVPKWLNKQSQLVLQVGLNMAVHIPDLEVGDEVLSCTLSFNRAPFWCRVPWSAVFALVGEDGRGMVWPDDVPSEVSAQQQKPALKVVGNKKARKKGKIELLHRVDSDGGNAARQAPDDEPSDAGADAPAEAAPALAAVPDDPPSEPEAPEAEEEAKDGGGKKLPPYLRVIK